MDVGDGLIQRAAVKAETKLCGAWSIDQTIGFVEGQVLPTTREPEKALTEPMGSHCFPVEP